jgi:hypothetical protein
MKDLLKVNKSRFNIIIFLIGFFVIFDQEISFSQAEIPDSIVRLRIQHIEKTLEKNKRNGDLWNYGWIGIYSTGTVAQGFVYFTNTKKGLRQDMALGVATTLLADVFQIIDPLKIGKNARKLSEIKDETSEERMIKLTKAEEIFKSLANREKSGKSWKIHALNGAVNLSSGLITWLAFKRTVWDGIINFAMNSAISELQICSQPSKTLRDYELYKQQFNPEIITTSKKKEATYFFSTYAGGISLKMIF